MHCYGMILVTPSTHAFQYGIERSEWKWLAPLLARRAAARATCDRPARAKSAANRVSLLHGADGPRSARGAAVGEQAALVSREEDVRAFVPRVSRTPTVSKPSEAEAKRAPDERAPQDWRR